MSERSLHVIHLLIRSLVGGEVAFLAYPHPKWRNSEGEPFLTLPAKKTRVESEMEANFQPGASLEVFVDRVMREDLALPPNSYVLEQEIEPAFLRTHSANTGEPTAYTLYAVDVWVHPEERERLLVRRACARSRRCKSSAGEGTPTAKRRQGRLCEEGSEGSRSHSDDLMNKNSI